MNILIIAKVDHSGAGYALMNAINKTTNHKARAISFRRSWVQYPYDVLNPDIKTLKRFIEWADVLNLHDEYALNTKKPIIMTYHGTWYRNQYKKINTRDKKLGYAQTALTIDLSLLGAQWTGRAMPDLQHMKNQNDEFTIVHAPTQRYRKGTNAVIKAMRNDNLVLIEKQTHNQCLKMKAKGHVLIDQVGNRALGYGTNALEAWAMGIPVISGAPTFIIDEMVTRFGYLPFISVKTVDDIQWYVNKLKNDEEYYQKWQRIGLNFVKKFHSQEFVAQQFVNVCRKAMR